MANVSPNHPLALMMADLVHEQVGLHIGSVPTFAEEYLASLLLDFIRTDRLYSIRDSSGQPVTSVIEMVSEGDVRLRADSFEREREVHKHIGDFILFWTGIYPDHLRKFRLGVLDDVQCDYSRQGRESYHVVSTFDHPPYDRESALFETLSEGFEEFAFVLRQVGRRSGLYAA
ncbi:MAG: hypothetical protein JNM28_04960 [Armatimonadetes bacterium]|nr:hypothetical protein [Armatimonadota bacterium]MBS1712473.1 hypothetical protein [Armatimonadota bacterium]MBX3109218.1 hypothetical protein [Fimbriimonadaceae bacterium]